MQAVLKDELPLVRLVEKFHPVSEVGVKSSAEYDADLPFLFYSAVITPDKEGERIFKTISSLKGRDRKSGIEDAGLRNFVVWKDKSGVMRMLMIPRSSHRPECFFAPEGERLMVSPGTIDMCGIIVVPREDDFRRITDKDLSRIFSEVAFPQFEK